MKRNIPTVITILSVLIAATSFAVALRATQQRKAAEAETQALRQRMADENNRTARRRPVQAMKNDIAQEAQADTNALVVVQEAETQSDTMQEQEQPRRESFEERMAKFKEEDPEGYAEMIERREDRQQKMRYSLAERTATFLDLDTTNMTEEELANHELLIEKMANVWALTEQFQDPEAAPDREAMREFFDATQEVRPLLREERTVMFKQLGADLGYEGEESYEFADHIEEILQATSLQLPGRGGRGGGGRGGGGRGGGGGGGGDRNR